MSAIFISYRREDSEDSTRAIFESLRPQFGKDRLFMDVEAIALGSDFRDAVERSLSSCGVFLAVIGPNWLNAKASADPTGARRLDNPGDYVRQEVASALKKGRSLPVIPVLVRGASMPAADQLPDDLKDLAYRNALSLNNLDWDSNVAKLVDAIRPHVGEPKTSGNAPPVTAAALPGRNASMDSAASMSSAVSIRFGKGFVAGIVAILIAAAGAGYLLLKPKPETTLTVTVLRNPRLTNIQGPVDVSIDDHAVGQVRFASDGSTPLQLQVSEGTHQFKIVNPQSNASCSGTFSVNSKQTKFMLRMRDNGTACAFDTALAGS